MVELDKHLQAEAASGRRLLEVAGQPQVEAPPAKQRARVHQRQRDRQRRKSLAKRAARSVDCACRAPFAARQISGSRPFAGPRSSRRREGCRRKTRRASRRPAERNNSPPRRARSRSPSALCMKRERFATMFGGPRLGHERRAARPLAAHAEAQADAEDDECAKRRREPARRGEDGIEHDARHQRARAAESIRESSRSRRHRPRPPAARRIQARRRRRSRVQGPCASRAAPARTA